MQAGNKIKFSGWEWKRLTTLWVVQNLAPHKLHAWQRPETEKPHRNINSSFKIANCFPFPVKFRSIVDLDPPKYVMHPPPRQSTFHYTVNHYLKICLVSGSQIYKTPTHKLCSNTLKKQIKNAERKKKQLLNSVAKYLYTKRAQLKISLISLEWSVAKQSKKCVS